MAHTLSRTLSYCPCSHVCERVAKGVRVTEVFLSTHRVLSSYHCHRGTIVPTINILNIFHEVLIDEGVPGAEPLEVIIVIRRHLAWI